MIRNLGKYNMSFLYSSTKAGKGKGVGSYLYLARLGPRPLLQQTAARQIFNKIKQMSENLKVSMNLKQQDISIAEIKQILSSGLKDCNGSLVYLCDADGGSAKKGFERQGHTLREFVIIFKSADRGSMCFSGSFSDKQIPVIKSIMVSEEPDHFIQNSTFAIKSIIPLENQFDRVPQNLQTEIIESLRRNGFSFRVRNFLDKKEV